MVVPYYHRQDPSIDQRSFVVSLSMNEDIIHEDLTKINNLEMKLEESIQYQVQEEDKSTQLTGTAIMYPGLEPYEGDLFFLEVDNHQSVIFVITRVEPTTWRQERYYKVSFYSYSHLTKQLLDRIESAVTESCYFERRKYFGESQLSMLSSESWKMLKELQSLRKKIAQDMINYFFNRDAESFYRPDGLYDPYIVEYLRSKITIQYDFVHPLQLVVPLRFFEWTIWYKFMQAENYEDLSDIWQYCVIVAKDPRTFHSDFNYLTGGSYLVMSQTGNVKYPDLNGGGLACGTGSSATLDCGYAPKDPRYPHLIYDQCVIHGHFPDRRMGYSYHYPECPVCSSYCNGPQGKYGDLFSDMFYSGFEDAGTDSLERHILRWLKYRQVNIPSILSMVRDYRKLGSGVLAFYKWALYLELMDACIVAIR